jgi:hypothetical protein
LGGPRPGGHAVVVRADAACALPALYEALERANEVRWLALPLAIQSWSLTSVQQRLFKTGGRIIRHARYFIIQLAERHGTPRLFEQILGRIERLAGIRPDPESCTRSEGHELREGAAAAGSLHDTVGE